MITKTLLIVLALVLSMRIVCFAQQNEKEIVAKDTVDKPYLYYGIMGVKRATKDTLFLENNIMFIIKDEGILFYKIGDQPEFPVPDTSYDKLSDFIFQFLPEDKYSILERMAGMGDLLANSKIGIDIASYQSPKPINWAKVKADKKNAPVEFVFIRSTLGYNNVFDSNFFEHYTQSVGQNFKVGFYHNFVLNRQHRPDYKQHAKEQAEKFVAAFKNKKVSFKPVLDIETHPTYAVVEKSFTPIEIREATKIFIDIVEQKLKTKVILYTFESFYNSYLKGYFDDKNVWIARYPHTDEFGKLGNVPGAKNPYLGISYDFKTRKFNYNLKTRTIGWQFSENGAIDGISAKGVDLSIILNKDYDLWLW